MTNPKYNQSRTAETIARYSETIRACTKQGHADLAHLARRMAVKPQAVKRFLRKYEKDLPADVEALEWVQGILYVMPPSQSGKMAAPRKKRSFGKPIANAEVKTGGKAELISYNAKPPAPITLSKIPFEIDGLVEKYQWAKPKMGVSHERA